MDASIEIRRARQRAGLSQRALAARAGTSQATIAAYETGRKQPSVRTLDRLLGALGSELVSREYPGGRTYAGLVRAGEGLADVVALAELLPFRRSPDLTYPRLPTRP